MSVGLAPFVEEASACGASTIHFEPAGNDLAVRLRIDGHIVWSARQRPTRALADEIVEVAALAPDEPSTGVIDVLDTRWRVAATPSSNGLLICLHRPGTHALAALGLDDAQRRQVTEGLGRGMTVFTGPPGHGKTTTFYAVLAALTHQAVTTIEQPIERVVPGLRQLPWPTYHPNPYDLARVLGRTNPDVVGIGELDNPFTVTLAHECANAGHATISTLCTIEASTVVSRLLGLGLEPFLLASTLRQVVCQRLLRRSCPHCRIPDRIDAAELARLGVDASVTPMVATGCERCAQTGFHGQLAVFEVMTFTDQVVELILQGGTAPELRAQAVRGGLVTLRQRAISIVATGELCVEQALRTPA